MPGFLRSITGAGSLAKPAAPSPPPAQAQAQAAQHSSTTPHQRNAGRGKFHAFCAFVSVSQVPGKRNKLKTAATNWANDSATRQQVTKQLLDAHRYSHAEVNLSKRDLTALPDCFGYLDAVQELNLRDNKLTVLPESIGDAQMLEILDLSFNELTSLPQNLFQNRKKRLQINVEGNRLTSLPEYNDNAMERELVWEFYSGGTLGITEFESLLKNLGLHGDDNRFDESDVEDDTPPMSGGYDEDDYRSCPMGSRLWMHQDNTATQSFESASYADKKLHFRLAAIILTPR